MSNHKPGAEKDLLQAIWPDKVCDEPQCEERPERMDDDASTLGDEAPAPLDLSDEYVASVRDEVFRAAEAARQANQQERATEVARHWIDEVETVAISDLWETLKDELRLSDEQLAATLELDERRLDIVSGGPATPDVDSWNVSFVADFMEVLRIDSAEMRTIARCSDRVNQMRRYAWKRAAYSIHGGPGFVDSDAGISVGGNLIRRVEDVLLRRGCENLVHRPHDSLQG